MNAYPCIEHLHQLLDAVEAATGDAAKKTACDAVAAEVKHVNGGLALIQELHAYLLFGGDFAFVRNTFADFAEKLASQSRWQDSEGGGS